MKGDTIVHRRNLLPLNAKKLLHLANMEVSMVLRPELLLLTLVTGPELTALLQARVCTFGSGTVLKGTKSSDPRLKQDSQFQSCDQGQGQ